MSAKIDPVLTARYWSELTPSDSYKAVRVPLCELVHYARVVIAASEFIAAERNVRDAEYETPLAYIDAVREMNEAHAAMCAAFATKPVPKGCDTCKGMRFVVATVKPCPDCGDPALTFPDCGPRTPAPRTCPTCDCKRDAYECDDKFHDMKPTAPLPTDASERGAFVEVLNAYVEAEIDYRNQTGLDGMDNGGPRRTRMQTLREAVLRRYYAALQASRDVAGVTEEEMAEAIRLAINAIPPFPDSFDVSKVASRVAMAMMKGEK